MDAKIQFQKFDFTIYSKNAKLFNPKVLIGIKPTKGPTVPLLQYCKEELPINIKNVYFKICFLMTKKYVKKLSQIFKVLLKVVELSLV